MKRHKFEFSTGDRVKVVAHYNDELVGKKGFVVPDTNPNSQYVRVRLDNHERILGVLFIPNELEHVLVPENNGFKVGDRVVSTRAQFLENRDRVGVIDRFAGEGDHTVALIKTDDGETL